MEAFAQATALIAVAELGDKSQLAALAFATRYSVRTTLLGITLATLFVHLCSTLLGEVLGAALPSAAIQLLAGLAFIAFGVWTLRGDTFDDDSSTERKLVRFGPLTMVVITFFLAELGDKTMLATVALGSQLNAFVAVWLGSTLGMVAADALAICLGRILGRQLPAGWIKLGAAVVFFGFGLWSVSEVIRSAVFPPS